jgi:hypothetical protein
VYDWNRSSRRRYARHYERTRSGQHQLTLTAFKGGATTTRAFVAVERNARDTIWNTIAIDFARARLYTA